MCQEGNKKVSKSYQKMYRNLSLKMVSLEVLQTNNIKINNLKFNVCQRYP